jgi:hypothetical protein
MANYGMIQGELEEVAMVNEVDSSKMGSRDYLVTMKLVKRGPNMIPIMLGQSIVVSYEGNSTICKQTVVTTTRKLNMSRDLGRSISFSLRIQILVCLKSCMSWTRITRLLVPRKKVCARPTMKT